MSCSAALHREDSLLNQEGSDLLYSYVPDTPKLSLHQRANVYFDAMSTAKPEDLAAVHTSSKYDTSAVLQLVYDEIAREYGWHCKHFCHHSEACTA